MRKLFALGLFILFFNAAFSQTNEKTPGRIDVDGTAKMMAEPDSYFAIITIQEVEQKIGYTTVGKTPIDSIKMLLTEAVKKYNLNFSKDLLPIGTTSREANNGQTTFNLTVLTYSAKVSKELAKRMADEMRFYGLKGVMVTWTISESEKTKLRDRLYEKALEDARKSADFIASKTNKAIADLKSVSVYSLDMYKLEKDLYDVYNNFRYEYDSRDFFVKCVLKVSYEMK